MSDAPNSDTTTDALDRAHALLRERRIDDAAQALASITSPDSAALQHAWAALWQLRGDTPRALQAIRRAVALAPEEASWWIALGQLSASSGEAQEAIAAFREALRLQPDRADVWYLLGMTLYGAHQDADAVHAFQQAHGLQPASPVFLRGLAEAEYAVELHARALAHYRSLVEQGVAMDAGLHLRLSQCERRCGFPQRALQEVQCGLQAFPEQAMLWLELGWVHEDLGDASSALQAYAKAHALQPSWGDPIGAALMHAEASDAWVAQAQELLASPSLPEPQRAYLHHALGKRADRLGEFDAAAGHWQQANRLRRGLDGAFDRAAFSAKIDAAIRAFDADSLARLNRDALQDERPIFVLGMPRSGTTLVEQILAAHPQVSGCGERTDIVAIAQALADDAGLSWPADASRIDRAWLDDRARSYLRGISGQDGASTRRWVDKQPYNFLHVGLIAMLFRDARIVWCRRDPRDVALSIYSESFAPSADYATDLDDIAFVIAEQERLMRHWQAVSPLPLLELGYEALIAEGEPMMRRLIDFAGLEWDEACLAFHQSGRPVQTLSRWQVRQPLHSRSVGRWRRYPQWFDGG